MRDRHHGMMGPCCYCTLFTFPLVGHLKRRYKICICSVILGKLESFRNYKGFSCIFPKILDAISAHYEKGNFFDSIINHIIESENFL